ncbi:glyoxalase [Paenibacillus sp. SYP-B3998]|uniref:Glyoxalase n=1 Tax=Paenibacillus sp. SYP-B3998 TaxID=2678564 RepID=A0A6G3ZZ61_9BACL|nr:VOC family protein [Paenibacillus sp. SYP-B3998]NEW07422.1 glyoxalase [Paenibacillus sp. SYP-B3998]
MKTVLAVITILTDDVDKMMTFYENILGFHVESQMEGYAELRNEGVRFSICARSILAEITDQHPSFREPKRGQCFELSFPLDSHADVDKAYEEIVEAGATPIKGPTTMHWGHRTAFFADPDGNIHSIYAI